MSDLYWDKESIVTADELVEALGLQEKNNPFADSLTLEQLDHCVEAYKRGVKARKLARYMDLPERDWHRFRAYLVDQKHGKTKRSRGE